MSYGKDTCSSCGKYTDIAIKVVEDVEMLYCKECRDKELKIVLENFNQINFSCIRCGSQNVRKHDPKAEISLTDVPNTLFASAFIACSDCKHRFFVNMEDHGKII
jgi:DNA-directed RNA polymerase subunit RPC12/RpoP